ncbi:MAG: hypothetical protein KJ042_08710 [Deltaproteobacteria bacterium]|nr:hypothetical protein [Deltaproteobacteria bacterium]
MSQSGPRPHDADRRARVRELRARARRIGWRAKIAMGLISLIASLALAELGLRFTSKLYFRSEYGLDGPHVHGADRSKDVRTVLCVGDSFTWGGAGTPDETYPAYLAKILNAAGGPVRWRVINRGICESNTSRHRQEIEGWLREYKPDVVVLLAGSANRFNPWDYDLWADRSAGHALASWFAHLRIVKVARILHLNGFGQSFAEAVFPAANRFAFWEMQRAKWRESAETDAAGPLREIWRAESSGRRADAIAIGRAAIDRGEADDAIYCSVAWLLAEDGNETEATSLSDVARDRFPDSRIVRNFQAAYSARRCEQLLLRRNAYDDGVAQCLDALDLVPTAFPIYYGITKYFDRQSRFSARMVYDRLESVAERHPEVLDYGWFHDYLAIFRDKDAWEAGVRGWMWDDLNEIAETCARQQVSTIVLNYPVDYPLANGTLRELAEARGLAFVDLRATFAELEPRSRYLLDDDHCTSEGHRVMAEAVAAALARRP